jgi:hypothetical protein
MPAVQPAVKLPRLTQAQIAAELASLFDAPSIGNDDDVGDYVDRATGQVAALWQPLVELPSFASRGLDIGPNDLRAVATIGELVSVIDWGLRRAER